MIKTEDKKIKTENNKLTIFHLVNKSKSSYHVNKPNRTEIFWNRKEYPNTPNQGVQRRPFPWGQTTCLMICGTHTENQTVIN